MPFTESTYVASTNFLVSILKSKQYDDEDISFRLAAPNTKDAPFKVEVRQSKIHGKGVYTTCAVKKGEVLTTYPCHLYGLMNEHTGMIKVFKGSECSAQWDIKYAQCLTSSKDFTTYIVGDPTIAYPSACGHLINDAYHNVEGLYNLAQCNIDKFGKSVLDYKLRTIHFANCAIKSTKHYAYVVAMKDIDADTELLTAYGATYWIKITKQQFVDKMVKYLTTIPPKTKTFALNILDKYRGTFNQNIT